MLELEVVHSQGNCCVVRELIMADIFGIGLFVWFVDDNLQCFLQLMLCGVYGLSTFLYSLS